MHVNVTHAKVFLVAALVGVVAFALPAGLTSASHVRIETGSVYAPPVAPPGALTPPPTLQAEEIKAHQVRAHTIYANKIEADEVRGAIHHTRGVKIGDAHGEIRAPEVTASVIYADVITANSVVAEVVYVRDLRRK
ncbi:MAG: hypothetical protein HYV93_17600 [Candidatus Rokubacteria bacterium]|nr:hypothetical protein [Candidatus Rokubacteria bacterium]